MEETKKDPRTKQKKIAILTETGVLILIYALLYYMAHPALNIRSMGLWVYVMSFIALWAVFRAAILYLVNDSTPYNTPEWLKKEAGRTNRIWIVLLSVITVFFLACGFGSRIFHAKGYSRIVTAEEADENIIPSSEASGAIALMDTASAQMLGDRKIGSLTDVVSQFDIS